MLPQIIANWQLDAVKDRWKETDVEITGTDGFIFIFHGSSDLKSHWLKRLQNEQYLYCLDFSNLPFTDNMVRDIGKLHELKYLNISNTKISNEGMVEISKIMPNLSEIFFSACQVDDTGFVHLAKLEILYAIEAEATLITDKGVESLVQVDQLTILCVKNTLLTDKSIPFLLKMKLAMLNIEGTGITRDGVERLLRGNPICLISHEFQNELPDQGAYLLPRGSSIKPGDFRKRLRKVRGW